MMSAEQNERVMRVGPGTPCGALMRRYWQPVALAEELAAGAAAARGARARARISCCSATRPDGSACSTATARIAAPIWPSAGSRMAGCAAPSTAGCSTSTGAASRRRPSPRAARSAQRVRQQRLPGASSRTASIFAYLGAGEPPAFPGFDCFVAPDSTCFAFKGHIDCNWLQALEVGIDPGARLLPASLLRGRGPARRLRQAVPRRLDRLRHADDAACCANTTGRASTSSARTTACASSRCARSTTARTHVRVTNLVFPHAFVIPMSAEMTITQWHVPVDDTSCYWYAIFTSFAAPVDKAEMRRQRLELYTLPDYKPRAQPRQQLRLRCRRAAEPDLSPAWASTSTSTTSGRSNRQGRDPGPHARASGPDRQGDHRPIAACCSRRSPSAEAGETPLDGARRRRAADRRSPARCDDRRHRPDRAAGRRYWQRDRCASGGAKRPGLGGAAVSTRALSRRRAARVGAPMSFVADSLGQGPGEARRRAC